MIKYLYYKFIYRHLMKLAHKHGWHQMRTCYPDGDTLLRCDWCGLSVVTQRAKYSDNDVNLPQQEIENAQIYR